MPSLLEAIKKLFCFKNSKSKNQLQYRGIIIENLNETQAIKLRVASHRSFRLVSPKLDWNHDDYVGNNFLRISSLQNIAGPLERSVSSYTFNKKPIRPTREKSEKSTLSLQASPKLAAKNSTPNKDIDQKEINQANAVINGKNHHIVPTSSGSNQKIEQASTSSSSSSSVGGGGVNKIQERESTSTQVEQSPATSKLNSSVEHPTTSNGIPSEAPNKERKPIQRKEAQSSVRNLFNFRGIILHTPQYLLDRLRFRCPFIFIQTLFPETEVCTGSWLNKDEASKCVKISRYVKNQFSSSNVAIVTPFYPQVLELRSQSKKFGFDKECRIGTVEQFLDENKFDIVVLSSVLSIADRETYSLYKRLELVASKANYFLIVVGNPNMLKKNKFWRDYIQNALNLTVT